jgi:hypothetical protein
MDSIRVFFYDTVDKQKRWAVWNMIEKILHGFKGLSKTGFGHELSL